MRKQIERMTSRSDEDLTREEKEYIDSLPSQDPLGIIALLFGGAGFAFGDHYLWLAICSVLFGILTLITFDKSKYDNRWPIYTGLLLGAIGVVLNLVDYTHFMNY